MEEPNQNAENRAPSPVSLKLHGSWASSYTHRIQLALKLKNAQFDYIEEDLEHKSPALLLHNPIYKKVPVLVADGRPIAESLIILQFLDDRFPDPTPALLPAAPQDRAIARFWAHFADDRLGPAVAAVFSSSGDSKHVAVSRFRDELRFVEKELSDGAFAGRRFFAGDRIGFLDIVMGCGSYWISIFEEVGDLKLFDAGEFPRFNAWLRDFEEQEEVKAIIPPFDRLLGYARGLRKMMLDSDVNGDGVAGEVAGEFAGGSGGGGGGEENDGRLASGI